MSAAFIWSAATLSFALMVPITLAAALIDRRQLAGTNVWAKPFKFALALALHYATFAVIVGYLPDGRGTGNVVLAAASSLAGALELAYIATQAARGRHSHFNDATRFEAIASVLMGIGALIVIAPALVIGLGLILSPPLTWPTAITWGTAWGLFGGAVLTVVIASRMGAARSRFVTGEPDQDRAMPVTGWSLDGADLRPAHFLATHMMQVLPLAAVIATETLPTAAALAMTLLIATVWTGVTLALFNWTMKGRPLSAIRPGVPMPRSR